MGHVRAPLADSFDADKGMPPEASRAVVAAVLAAAAGVPGAVVEIGAGTGEIGVHLVAAGRPYAGLDASREMLVGFVRRCSAKAPLVEGDATRPWPVRRAGAAVVFGSRVFHLLDPPHVAEEAARLLVPGGILLAGRVPRDPDNPRERLRELMRGALRRRGIAPPDPRGAARHLLDLLAARGATPLAACTVAEWTAARRPAASLDTWRTRPGLPGCPHLAPSEKDAILAEVEAAFRTELGDPEAPVDSRERFVLEGARLP